jgi:MEDS: MEthanogen/methylotroph, DcmR Sensory domain
MSVAEELTIRERVTSEPGERFRSGIDGVDIEPDDHICCFYSGLDECDRILLPYLRAGVRDGEKCICLIDATDPEVMRVNSAVPRARCRFSARALFGRISDRTIM